MVEDIKLSIVTTLYHSAPYLEEFYDRTAKTAKTITENYEIIMVNDGSPDNSLDIALDLQKKDDRITVVNLSRNFGHHSAVMAGLSFARGEWIFLNDCDLEQDPEYLAPFYEQITSDPDCDMLYGTREKRVGTWFSKAMGALFYRVLNSFLEEKLDPNAASIRIMSRRYVNSLLSFRERALFLAGLCRLAGYTQKTFVIKTHFKGSSTYSLRRKMGMAINAITSFSNKPLLYISYLGVAISSLSALFLVFLLINKGFVAVMTGWTSLMISIWFIGGLTILCVGIVGIYLSTIFLETKQRPRVIVKDVYRGKSDNAAGES